MKSMGMRINLSAQGSTAAPRNYRHFLSGSVAYTQCATDTESSKMRWKLGSSERTIPIVLKRSERFSEGWNLALATDAGHGDGFIL